jgi:hypothetical protein
MHHAGIHSIAKNEIYNYIAYLSYARTGPILFNSLGFTLEGLPEVAPFFLLV